MYSVIENNREHILDGIDEGYVNRYEPLLENLNQSGTADYQREYKSFWEMNQARLGEEFYRVYFELLGTADPERINLGNVCRAVSNAAVRRNGAGTLQFSFATKLQHMLNPRLPIYDSRVARFFWFQEPSTDMDRDVRVERYLGFHTFLVQEYARVIAGELLIKSIAEFRKRFATQRHTDEKIIDWLLWSFAGLANRGALVNRQITFD